MQQTDAVIGGEGNGGVINPDLHYGRDALVGTAMILQLLAERKITASEYRASLPHYEMSKQKIELGKLGMEADELLEKITDKFSEFKPDTIDGVKVNFEDGWVHFRKSNTEPIVRVYSEAKSKEVAEELAQRILSELK